MSPTLLWPLGLLAGLAVLAPLWIHWLPRRQSAPRRFAALRFIGQHAAPRRQRRLAEWPLLILRILIVLGLAAWLAWPVLSDWPGRGLAWEAVWPGVDTQQLPTPDSQVRRVWLTPGFPGLDAGPPADSAGDTASLLRELAATLPREGGLSVWVPPVLHGLDGGTLQLARAVDWRPAPAAPAPDALPTPTLRRLAVRIEDGGMTGPWLDAALEALRTSAAPAIEIDRGPPEQAVPPDTEALLWLGDTLPTSGFAEGTRVVQVTSASLAGGEIEPLSGLPVSRLSGSVIQLQGPITQDALPAVLEPDFPERLATLLFRRDPDPRAAPADSLRPGLDTSAMSPDALSLRPWLAVLIALLFLAERGLASGRRLARAAP